MLSDAGVQFCATAAGVTLLWPWSEVRLIAPPTGVHPALLGSRQDPAARLEIAANNLAAFDPLWVFLRRNGHHRVDLTHRRWLIPAGVLACGLLAAVYVFRDSWSAAVVSQIPLSVDVRLGQQAARAFAHDIPQCGTPAAVAAMRHLTAHLMLAEGSGRPVTVTVLDVPEINAVAFPDGTVFVYRGLLETLKSPDELAGILAHEISHVTLRHSMQGLLYGQTLSLFATLVLGQSGMDTVTSLAVQTGYNRDAERAADRQAVVILKRAGILPIGLHGFFKRMLAEEGEHPELAKYSGYISSHPATAERISTLAGLTSAGKAPGKPVLSAEEWKTVQNSCDGD